MGIAAAALASALSVLAPAPVTALAADGTRVAYAAGRSGRDCDRVRIWDVRARTVIRLGRTTSCVATSTGTGIAAVSIAGARVLWLHYTGGNLREWRLFTATPTRRLPRRLAFVVRDVDDAAPIVLGDGDAARAGDLLPYAVGRTVVALRANGARRFSWTAPARVTAVSALGGELAVAYEGGRVAILDAGGRVLREETYAGDLQAVRLTGSGVLVQRGRTLEWRSGGSTWTRSLPAGAWLADAAGGRALYAFRGTIRTVSRATDERVAAGTLAQIEGPRLWVASGRRVTASR